MFELKVLNCDSVCPLICTTHKGFHWFFSALSFHTICQVESYIFFRNSSIFAITKTSHSTFFIWKQLEYFQCCKKITMYYDNICKKKNRRLESQWENKVQQMVSTLVFTRASSILYYTVKIYCASIFPCVVFPVNLGKNVLDLKCVQALPEYLNKPKAGAYDARAQDIR